jgi:hypothetical protein
MSIAENGFRRDEIGSIDHFERFNVTSHLKWKR